MLRRTAILSWAMVAVVSLALGYTLVWYQPRDTTHQVAAASPVTTTTIAPTTTEEPTTTTELVTTTTAEPEPVTTVVRRARITAPPVTEAPVETAAQVEPQPEVTPTPDPGPASGCSIDISIGSQTLTATCGDETRTMAISSGMEQHYCENGVCGEAVTPRGSFSVCRKYDGTETAPLGTLYRPIYFDCGGGYAIHGGNLPGYPASHGCVRVSYDNADWLFDRVQRGDPVSVHD